MFFFPEGKIYNVLTLFLRFNAKRSAEHHGLDANFVEDLLPKLYESVEKTATIVATCRDEIPPGVVTTSSGVASSLRGLASAVKLKHSYGHTPPPCRGPVHMKIKVSYILILICISMEFLQRMSFD